LTAYGFNGVLNEKTESRVCKEITINLPQSAILEKGEGILSINALFSDYQNDSSYISFSINGGAEEVLWPEDFVCNGNCWARIFLPELKKGTTKVNICAVLGGLTKSVSITNNTFIGVYDSPVLSIQNSAPSEIYLGERAKMSIVVSNTGTKAAEIYVQFVHPDTRAKVPIASFDIVEGESSATTTIAAGETKRFVYYIKPSLISSYNLPSAALFFTNYFGEKQVMLSEHPMMSVVEQKQVVISLVALGEKKPYTFKAIIKNNLSTTFNGSVFLTPQTVIQNPVQEFSIGPNSEKEITFTATDLEAGKYSFVANIRDGNEVYVSNPIDLEIKQEGIPFEIVFALIGIILGVAIFAWVYFVKSK
jgi:hypothetical protein